MRRLGFHQPVRKFILSRKKQSLMIVFLGMLAQLLTIMIPVSVGKYYQLAFGLSGRRAEFLNFIPPTWWDTVPEFLLFFVVLVVVRYFCYFIYQTLLRKEAEYFIKSIKDKLFKRQLSIAYSVYQEKGIGKYLLRYSGDLNSLKNVYIKGGLSVFADIFIVILAFAWFFLLSASGAWVILIGSIFAYVMVHWFNQRIEHYSRLKRDQSAGQLSFVSRTLQSMVSVLLMNKQSTEQKKFRKRSAAIAENAIAYHRWQVINNGFIAFLQYGLLAWVLYLFYLQSDNRINGANLTSFILLYLTVLPVIRRLFRLPTIYQLGSISLKKMNDIFTLPTENPSKGKALIDENILAFKSVDFGYGPVTAGQQEGNIIINLPTEQAADRLFQALTRINDNYQGEITLNGVSLRDYQPESLRNKLSILSIKSPLLGRTVYEAITVSRSEKNRKKAEQWLQTVQRHLGIGANQQLTLDDKIGENGSSLSAWQYQLLCLVRTLNEDKPVVFCDTLDLIPVMQYHHLLSTQKKQLIFCHHH